jgi:5-methylcytosine-specific restriction enzyme subunit McrC
VDGVRTLELTERIPAIVRLPPAAADFLLAGWGHAVSLAPTRRRHRYRLTPLGHVGVLPAPGVRLVVRPKIPLRNVFFMLEPAAPLPASADATDPEPAGPLVDFLAGQLARRMAERAAAGLHRDYAERHDAGPFLRGRPDLPAQLREPPAGKLHGVFDDFTTDVPCNRVPCATCERLLPSPLLGGEARSALRRALAGFDGVESATGPYPARVPEAYRPLLELCQLLDEALRPGESAGTQGSPAFLLDLGRVFERYVAGGLVAAGRSVVRVQPTATAGGPGGLVLRPDLLIGGDGGQSVVADTKWKRGPVAPPDAYQVIAYATAFGARRAVLICPGQRDGLRAFDVGPVRLEVRLLDVAGTPGACRRSLRRLARRVTGGRGGARP